MTDLLPSDLNQVSAMLRHATGRSLLLLDEFGKGTNVVDGVSVLGGVLHHLLSREDIPKAIVSTHFSEYFHNRSLLPSSRFLSFIHMDIFIKEEEPTRDIVFLYKLKPGIATQSYGHFMARLAGIPQSIAERAEAVKALFIEGELVRPLNAGQSQRRREDCEAIFQKLLAFDCTSGDVRAFLSDVWNTNSH